MDESEKLLIETTVKASIEQLGSALKAQGKTLASNVKSILHVGLESYLKKSLKRYETVKTIL
ncbi:MAG: hypothetical protein PVI23_16405, partial [Maricaulaceae bacterium]